jgi:hypothetical protein
MNSTQQSRGNANQQGLAAWLRQAKQMTMHPRWQLIGAVFVTFFLLFVFHQVVAGAVEQAQLRHKSLTMQHDSDRRCKPVQGLADRTACIERAAAAQSRATSQVANRTNN